MRVLRIALAAAIIAVPLLSAAPAQGALTGNCRASGTVSSTGRTYNAKTTDKVTLPLADTITWTGAVQSPAGTRSISGAVHVKFPPPIGAVNIGSWSKKSSTQAKRGVYHYSFPSVLGGFDIPVAGVHTEPGVTCAGAVIVHFDGGGFSNPAVIGSFVLLVISGVGIWIACKPKVV